MRFDELDFYIDVLKERNKFNLDNIIREELDEFYKADMLTKDADFWKKDLKDYTKDEVKVLENLLQEVSDVIVVISQVEGHFNLALRDKLVDEFNVELASYLETKFNEYVSLFYQFVVDTAKFKCSRTIFRNKFDYYRK